MKVGSSNYLKEQKPLLKKLLEILLEQYPYVSLLAEDCTGKQYQVSKRGTYVMAHPKLSGRGVVVRVYDGQAYGEYSFNTITPEEILKTAQAIKENLMPAHKHLPKGIKLLKTDSPLEEESRLFESTEYQIHPRDLGDERIISCLTDISQQGRAYHEKILDCTVMAAYQQYSKLFLSGKKELEQNVLWTTGAIVSAASRGEEIKDYYKGFSCLGGLELLEEMKKGLDEIGRSTLELLDSRPVEPGEYPCICSPDVTGMIVHEAFGHGVEMDMFVKKRALAEKYIGKYVASPLVTMHDGAGSASQTASYFFDDEGAEGGDTIIIDKGILKQGICDSLTADRLKVPSTGNGRRESSERKAYTRMTNTYFESGSDRVEDMIRSIDYGFLLENARSGMEDPKNWGIQCMVNIAREIKEGKLTGRIFSPIVLTGSVPDLLKSISMVSDEVSLSGSGFCGKGYKEWVKVSDGGPYMKANIRLG